MRILHALAAAGMVIGGLLVSGRPAGLAVARAEEIPAPRDAPLGAATPGPLRGLFLDMPLADARGPAHTTLELRWWMANSWSVPTTLQRGATAFEVQLDAQTETLQLAVAIPWRRFSGSPLAERLSTTVEARALALWGGWTDAVIEGWHGLVGSTNFERHRWPRDEVAVRLVQASGPRVVDARSGRFALGDVAIRSALRIVGASPSDAPSRWTLAARLDLKLPTGAAGVGGSGGVDAGVGVAATFLATRWLTAHALASLRAVSNLPANIALQPRRLQGGLDLSLVARLGAFTVLLEDRLSSPLFEGGWSLPEGEGDAAATGFNALFRPHNQVSVGLRWRELTAFLSEDFTIGAGTGNGAWFYSTNVPDVVLGVAWARGF